MKLIDKVIAFILFASIFTGAGYAWKTHHDNKKDMYVNGLNTGELRVVRFLQDCGEQKHVQWYGPIRCSPRSDGRLTLLIDKGEK
jgi:hypothetical protein